MKLTNNKIAAFFTFVLFCTQISINASEKYNCEQSVLKLYEKDFKCNNTNNFFLNNFYSDHISNYQIETKDKYGNAFIKGNNFNVISERLGLYLKDVSGKQELSFGFPEERMERDAISLWTAFNSEITRIIRTPIETEDLDNGFTSSIFSESF